MEFPADKAVQGITVLLLRAAAERQGAEPARGIPTLSGGAGSLAASLDYALTKEPRWLEDLFGCDSRGEILARRFIRRTNPGRRRIGPVALSLSASFAERTEIIITWEDESVGDQQILRKLAEQIASDSCMLQQGRGVRPVRDLSIWKLVAVTARALVYSALVIWLFSRELRRYESGSRMTVRA